MMDELYREELFKELSTFARANRKALRSAEQWLDEFDRGDFMAAWETAKNEVPTVDWQKIVYIAWWATDKKLYECKFEFIEKADLRKWCEEGQVYFLCDLMSSGRTATNEYSNLYLIRSALDKGRKAVKNEKTTLDIKPPLGEIAALIYEKLKNLPEHNAMNLPMIAQWLNDEHEINIDESTIRTNHIPQLQPYGLYHKKRIGYCLRQQ